MSSRRSTVFYGLLIAVSSLVVGLVLASRLDIVPHSTADTLTLPSVNSAPITGQLDATTFRTIAEQASPSVVSIITVSQRTARTPAEFFGFGADPFGGEGPGEPTPSLGAGSGFIIDGQGYILTNNHVVADATRIEVLLAGMDRPGLPATVVGRDELTDSALIKLDALPSEPLVPARFGDSSQIGPGDWVMAIGNPFALSHSVTVGVVSAVGRPQSLAVPGRVENMIQTDAAINQGNSGGPLLNLRGEVIGINTSIYSNQSAFTGPVGNIGIGFAVPINTVTRILDQLRTGHVERGRLGVGITSMNRLTQADAEALGLSSPAGVLVESVETDGPAARADMHVDDVITSYNGQQVRDTEELVSLVTGTTPGTIVPVTIVRNRDSMTVNVTVGSVDVELQRNTQVTESPRGRGRGQAEPTATGFGMAVRELTPAIARQLDVPNGQAGVLVDSVEAAGPAQLAGLAAGDVIVRINGTDVDSVAEVTGALDAVGAGRTARVVIVRQGQELLRLIQRR